MEERRAIKVAKIVLEVNDQIYDGQNKQIVVTNENGHPKMSVSNELYDMLTGAEQKRIEELAEESFSCEI